MKKLVLKLALAVGALFSGVSVNAQTIATVDYTKIAIYEQTKDDCVWATVDANYRYAEAYKLMAAVNAFRVENNMPALQTNDYCMQIAMQRALEYNILADHASPYWPVLDNCIPSIIAQAMGFAPNAITFTCVESCYGNYENTEAVLAKKDFQDRHTLDAGNAIGVGFVNDCAVFVIFKKEAALKAATDTRLTDYQATMKVPVNKKWVEQGLVTDGMYDGKVRLENSSNSDEQSNKEEEKVEEDKKQQQEVKQTESTKVSGLKLTRKRSGKNTKITVKFSKVKSCKYQIQVANNKKFKSAKKSSSSSNKKTVSVKYKGKKAYVRVRCYKKINGKTVYSKWSSVKSIKTYK